MFDSYKIIDGHVHFAFPLTAEDIGEAVNATQCDSVNLVTVPHRQRVSAVPEALMVKHLSGNRYYVFGNLDVSRYFRHPKTLGKHFADYAKSLRACGCDGIKIIEGKPQIRKMLPIPDFDAQCWEDFWAYAESTNLPILWHVNDPEEFWDKDKVPQWAAKQGWYYDSSYVNNEAQYTQVLNVLQRHPALNVTFAHFFFMSNCLERLQEVLNNYPNVRIDLTPGIEMYVNMSANSQKAREFLIANEDRIVYGTDIGARSVLGSGKGINLPECVNRSQLIRNFLLSDDKVTVKADGNFLIGTDDFELQGLGLPGATLKKIFADNFLRFVGQPSPVNPKRVIAQCKTIKMTMIIMSLFDKELKPNFESVNTVLNYFKAKQNRR